MSRPSKRTPKILVVDDDPGLLRLLTIRLRSQKYEVEPAESGAKALSIITRFRPDLVITDLRMAEMDGLRIPGSLRYEGLHALSFEARQKLSAARPETLGQAGRIPGVSPSDLQNLVIAVVKSRK